MSNSDNPGNGALFQKQVCEWFESQYEKKFLLEKKIAIGFDPDSLKEHKFDIIAEDDSMAIECKRYTWTETGNVPSAKMGFTNEAAFYLSLLPDSYEKTIVMLYSYSEKRGETLAEYYYRTNSHLLRNTRIAEYNPDTDVMRIVGQRHCVDINSIRAFISKQSWIFAKTYANKAPHEYVVRGRINGTDEEFMNVVNYIQEKGITMHYWGHPNRYIFVDRHQYWVMRDSEDDPTTILNRCNVDEYKYTVAWAGKKESEV